MKKYFLYELKKKAYLIICLSIIVTLIYACVLLTTRLYGNSNKIYQFDVNLDTINVLSVALAVIAPVIQFSYRMKRRSVDMYYSLPLSHYKIFTVKYLVGLIMVFAPYLSAYLIGALIMLIKTANRIFYGVYYIPHFFLTLPVIFLMYSLATFAFTRANNFIDGVIFIAFWALIWVLVAEFLGNFIYYTCHRTIGEYFYTQTFSRIYSGYYSFYSPLENLKDYFQAKLVGDTYGISDNGYNVAANMAAGYTLITATAVFGAVWTFVSEKYTKSENAGQISESYFGYKVMIPLYTVLTLCLYDLARTETYIFDVLIIVGFLLLTALYRRTVRIGLKHTLIFIGSVILGLIFSVIITLI